MCVKKALFDAKPVDIRCNHYVCAMFKAKLCLHTGDCTRIYESSMVIWEYENSCLRHIYNPIVVNLSIFYEIDFFFLNIRWCLFLSSCSNSFIAALPLPKKTKYSILINGGFCAVFLTVCSVISLFCYFLISVVVGLSCAMLKFVGVI